MISHPCPRGGYRIDPLVTVSGPIVGCFEPSLTSFRKVGAERGPGGNYPSSTCICQGSAWLKGSLLVETLHGAGGPAPGSMPH